MGQSSEKSGLGSDPVPAPVKIPKAGPEPMPKVHTDELPAMSNEHRLHGPILFNKKRCETYEELREVILNSTDSTTAQTFQNIYRIVWSGYH